MRRNDPSVAVLPVRDLRAATETTFAETAAVVGFSPDGVPLLQFSDGSAPMPARLALPLSGPQVADAFRDGHRAVVVFEDGNRSKPIVIAFLRSDSPLSAPARSGDVPSDEASASEPHVGAPCIEADVDGRRVRLTAQDEIVLQCGSASLTLRRNGRIVIRGTYVETRSDGTNRIKGGQVHIN